MKSIEKILFFLLIFSTLFSGLTIIPNRIVMIFLLISMLITKRFFVKYLCKKKWLLSIVILYILLIFFGNSHLSKEALLFATLPIYIVLFKHSSLNPFILKKYLIIAVLTYSALLMLIKSFTIISMGLNNFFEQEHWWNQILYKSLTEELDAHPTYISMFVISSIVLLLQQSFDSKKFFSRLQHILVLTLLFSILVLLLVKISFLAILMIFIVYCFFLIRSKNFKPVIYSTFLFFAIGTALYHMPGIKQRLINDFEFAKTYDKKEMEQNRINERVALWTASLTFIKSHPLTGTSIQGVSSKSSIYQEAKSIYPKLEYPKNCHNNFLEFGVRYGIFGFCIFLLFYIFIFREGIKQGSFEIIAMAILIGSFSLTESFMFREQGVSLIAILIAIFGIQLYGKNI